MESDFQIALEYIQSFDDPYLAALRNKGKPTWGSDNVRALLRDLGDPHLDYPTFHIAGTKGKGSTAAFIAQGLIEAGYKTGLYISPHLQDWRERIQVDRRLITGTELLSLVDGVKRFIDRYPTLSAFEVTTALAFWHFAREGCDAAVIEVGLGGRLDATNVVNPVVSVITNISYDHMQLLGDTLAEIAGEKAAIIKPGTPVASAAQCPEALEPIKAKAVTENSPLIIIGEDWIIDNQRPDWTGTEFTLRHARDSWRVRTNLPGVFQPKNAALAVAALHEANLRSLPAPIDAILRGIEKTIWPGRMEVIAHHPRVIVDGAHNVQSIAALIESLQGLPHEGGLTAVFGCMSDKDGRGMLSHLAPVCESIVFTRIDNPRAAEPARLLNEAVGSGLISGDRVLAASSVAEALDVALGMVDPSATLCVCGSLALAGEARSHLLQAVPETGRPTSTPMPRNHLD